MVFLMFRIGLMDNDEGDRAEVQREFRKIMDDLVFVELPNRKEIENRIPGCEIDLLVCDLNIPGLTIEDHMSLILEHTSDSGIILYTGMEKSDIPDGKFRSGLSKQIKKRYGGAAEVARSGMDILNEKTGPKSLLDNRSIRDIVAHDINNYNQGVYGYLELLKNKPSLLEDHPDYLDKAMTCLEMSSILVSTTGQEFREDTEEPVGLDYVLDEAERILRDLNPSERIRLNRAMDGKVVVTGNKLLIKMIVDLYEYIIMNREGEDPRLIVVDDNEEGRVSIKLGGNFRKIPEQNREDIFTWIGSDAGSRGELFLCGAIAGYLGGELYYSSDDSGTDSSGGLFIVNMEVKG